MADIIRLMTGHIGVRVGHRSSPETFRHKMAGGTDLRYMSTSLQSRNDS